MTYLAINLGLAAACVVARALLGSALGRRAIRFRDQLVASRALLLASLLVASSAAWVVQVKDPAWLTWLTWKVEYGTPGQDTDAMAAAPLPVMTSAEGAALALAPPAAARGIGWPPRFFWLACWVAFSMVTLWRFAHAALHYRKLSQCLARALILRRRGRTIIAASDAVTVPFSVHTWRSRWVVLPVQALTTRADLQLALRHELQHHRSGDCAWAWVWQALAILCWPNPFLHAWRRWNGQIQELACDEALRERRALPVEAYARCLLNVAERSLEARVRFQVAVSMATPGRDPQEAMTHLQRRIEMLFRAPTSRLSRASVLAFVVTAVCVSLGVSALAAGFTLSQRAAFVVDPTIQRIADDALAVACRDSDVAGGMVIVADPNDGRILAVAHAGSSADPLRERVEPASLAKTIIAAAAIEQGTTTAETKHDCEQGSYTVAGQTYHDYKEFTALSTSDTVALSSNICAIKIANTLGAERTRGAFATFGFGSDGRGHLPGPDEVSDSLATATYATGSAPFLATPLELVQAYGAIANGGRLLAPRNATDHAAPVVIRRVLSEGVASEVRRILGRVVSDGTASSHIGQRLPAIAGKTGTINHETTPGEHHPRSAASFVGFAPVDAPRLVAFVYIEGRDKMLTGGATAAPVFARISEQVLAAH